MPRDRGGSGRTGNKHKVAAEKRRLAAAAAAAQEVQPPASPAKIAAAPTNEDAEEIVGPLSSSVKKGKKQVSFAPLPRIRARSRHPRPTSEDWTWGGLVDHPWDWGRFLPDGSPRGLDNPLDGQALKMERQALKAHLRGLRMADSVARGCMEEWDWHRSPHERGRWRGYGGWIDVVQRPFRSHREWCPSLPVPPP